MWTPKRILLLFGGLFLFLFSYIVYAYFLGGIDGLSPLPVALHADPNEKPPLPPEGWKTEADRKLCDAFGDDCEEINRTIKVEYRARGLGLATDAFNIMKEDKRRVQLVPFSIALFGKNTVEGAFPEINTVKSDEAFLIFDQPIEKISDIGERKIVGAELHGKITIINNRRTAQKNDDIEVRIAKGPLFYSEAKSRIWSDGYIRLKDTQPKPEPTDITAIGLDIFLTKDAQLNPKKGKQPVPNKAGNKSVSGVEKLVLRGNVDMHFHIDAKSGFLGTLPRKKEEEKEPPQPKLTLPGKLQPPAPGKPALNETSHVIVGTQGPFTFDVEKDLAIFESPDPNANKGKKVLAPFPSDKVVVIRIHKEGEAVLQDELYCDRLELQFRKKKDVDIRGMAQNSDREIDSAKATAYDNRQVTVILNTENLSAYCEELIYNSPTETRGPETILSGKPMWAFKDAHKITAKEVKLVGANKKGEGQYAEATGPGQIDLIDHQSKSETHQYHAVWKKILTITKDKEGDRIFDLLTFEEQAGFIDDTHKQELHAEKLQVWLEQAERLNADLQAKQQKQKLAGTPRQQPTKIEGFDKVWVQSPDLNVQECDYLIVRFKNVPLVKIPDAIPASIGLDGDPKESDTRGKPNLGGLPIFPPPGANQAEQPADQGNKNPFHLSPGIPGQKNKEPRKPIDLKAKRVSVYIARMGNKNELEELVTEGKVHVQQEAEKSKDKGVDIRGETLNLFHHNDGDLLIVFGDANNPAQLQFGELKLIGPKVTLDQRENTAQVDGMGAMVLPSGTDFEGSKHSKPGVHMTIHWSNDMFFNGKDAAFQGNVLATQEKAMMRCQALHVFLDKMVSFKEGQKKGQGAKVERLVCAGKNDGKVDIKVDIEDTKFDPKNQFLRYDRLMARNLTMDNLENTVNAGGPGRVYLLQHGTVEDDPQKPASTQKQLYLTRVDYQGRLHSTKHKDNSRVAKFYDNIEVYHLPSNDPNIAVNPDKLPKGGMYLRSDRLTVYSKPGKEGKASQEMHAEGNVYFQAGEVRGLASVVKYFQETEQVIFEGTVGNRAILQKQRGPAIPPEELKGTSIIYNRKTGEFSLSGGGLIQGSGK